MIKIPLFRDVSHRSVDWPFESCRPTKLYCSACNQWCVKVFSEPSGAVRMGIRKSKKNDPQSAIEIVESWSFIHAIKEKLFPGRLAVEVFPAPADVVNAAPMRWLYILPKGMKLPFNLSRNSDELVA